MKIYNIYKNDVVLAQMTTFKSTKSKKTYTLIVGKQQELIDGFYSLLKSLLPKNSKPGVIIQDDQFFLAKTTLLKQLNNHLSKSQVKNDVNFSIKEEVINENVQNFKKKVDDEYHQLILNMSNEFEKQKEKGLNMLIKIQRMNVGQSQQNLHSAPLIQPIVVDVPLPKPPSIAGPSNASLIPPQPQPKIQPLLNPLFTAQNTNNRLLDQFPANTTTTAQQQKTKPPIVTVNQLVLRQNVNKQPVKQQEILATKYKIIPNVNNEQLTVFNQYFESLNELHLQNKISDEIYNNAKNAINCLAFIKVNRSFLMFAYEHKNDINQTDIIETHNEYKIIRDHFNTPIYLSDFNNPQTFVAAMTALAEHIEYIIALANSTKQLIDFTLYFKQQTDDQNCLDACRRLIFDFGKAFREAYIPTLDSLFMSHKLNSFLQIGDIHLESYERLKPYMHQSFIYNKEVIYLNKQYIDQYLETFFSIKKQSQKYSAKQVCQLIDEGDALVQFMTYQNLPPIFSQWLNLDLPQKFICSLLPRKLNMRLESAYQFNVDNFSFYLIADLYKAELSKEQKISKLPFNLDERSCTNFDKMNQNNYSCASLNELREYLEKNSNELLEPNQILADIPIEAVQGLACIKNTIADRWHLWSVQNVFQNYFGIHLPMLIITGGNKIVYDEHQQVRDVLKMMSDENYKFEFENIDCFKSLLNIDKITVEYILDCFIEHDMLAHAVILATIKEISNKQLHPLFILLCKHIAENFEEIPYLNNFYDKYKIFLFNANSLQNINANLKNPIDQFGFNVKIINLLKPNDKEFAKTLYKNCFNILIDQIDALPEHEVITFLQLIHLDSLGMHKERNLDFFENITNIIQVAHKVSYFAKNLQYFYLLLLLAYKLIKFNTDYLLLSSESLIQIKNNLLSAGDLLLKKITLEHLKSPSLRLSIINIETWMVLLASLSQAKNEFVDSFNRLNIKQIPFKDKDSLYADYYNFGNHLLNLNEYDKAKFCYDLIYKDLIDGVNSKLLNRYFGLKFLTNYVYCLQKCVSHNEIIPVLEFACEFIVANKFEINKTNYIEYKNQLKSYYADNKELLAKIAFDILSHLNHYPLLLSIKDHFEAIKEFDYMYLAKMPDLCMSLLNKLSLEIQAITDIHKINELCSQINFLYEYLKEHFSVDAPLNNFFATALQCVSPIKSSPEDLSSHLLTDLVKSYNNLQFSKDIMDKYIRPFCNLLLLLKDKKVEFNSFLISLKEKDSSEVLNSLIPKNTIINPVQDNSANVYNLNQTMTLFTKINKDCKLSNDKKRKLSDTDSDTDDETLSRKKRK